MPAAVRMGPICIMQTPKQAAAAFLKSWIFVAFLRSTGSQLPSIQDCTQWIFGGQSKMLRSLYILYSRIQPLQRQTASGPASSTMQWLLPSRHNALQSLQPPVEDEGFSMKVVFAQSATQWILDAQVATLHSLSGLYSLYSLTRPVGKRTS